VDPLIQYLLQTRTPLTVENYISINFCFEGYTTIAELEQNEMAEELAQIWDFVESGQLRDVKGEFKDA